MASPRTVSLHAVLQRATTPALIVIGMALMAAASSGRAGIQVIEAAGFITGGLCVYLLIRENIWNWPIGIANNLVYGAIFFHARLYADMTLQFVYVILGTYGWISWLRGKTSNGALPVEHTPTVLAVIAVAMGTAATWGLSVYLARIDDAAPLLDAVTTVMSLIAQYLMTRKFLENWTLWIVVDILSVGLYGSKHLYLTSLLYFVYVVMCAFGAAAWRRSMLRVANA